MIRLIADRKESILNEINNHINSFNEAERLYNRYVKSDFIRLVNEQNATYFLDYLKTGQIPGEFAFKHKEMSYRSDTYYEASSISKLSGFNKLPEKELFEIAKQLNSMISARIKDKKEIESLVDYLEIVQIEYISKAANFTDDQKRSFTRNFYYTDSLELGRNVDFYDKNYLYFNNSTYLDSKHGHLTEDFKYIYELLMKNNKTDVNDLFYIMSPKIGICFAGHILRSHNISEKHLDQIIGDINQEIKLIYSGKDKLNPDKQIVSLSLSDHISHIIFKDELNKTNTTKDIKWLTEYLKNIWIKPSQIRDIAIIEFIESKNFTTQELINIVPFLKDNWRLSLKLYDAWKEWSNQNKNATFDSKLDIIKGLFPDKSINRDKIILEVSKDHPINFDRFQKMQDLFSNEKESGKKSMLSEHYIQTFLNSVHNPKDKKDILLWAMGINNRLPHSCDFYLGAARIDKMWLKDLLKLPGERAHFIKSILIGSGGLCLEVNAETKKELLESIFIHYFAPVRKLEPGVITIALNPKQLRGDREEFVHELTRTIFKHLSPMRQFTLFNAISDMIMNSKKDNKELKIEDFIKTSLENIGAEGVKLAQILSSYRSLWKSDPELANLLSDLQDRANPIHHFELFKHLTATFGKDSVVDLEIMPSEHAGSIKSYFVANKGGKDQFGILYLRPQVVKYLLRNCAEMENILLEAQPIIEKYYGGKIPPHIPSLIYHLIKREIDFNNESTVINEMANNNSGEFKYPKPRSEWSNGTTIGIEHIFPNFSIKSLLKLETDPAEWHRMNKEEKALIGQILGIKCEDYFDHKKFKKFMQSIKPLIQKGLISQLVNGKYSHLDPHTGNILFRCVDNEIFLTDLGSMVALKKDDKKLIINSLIGLITKNSRMLNKTINKHFGNQQKLDFKKVFDDQMKYRAVQYLETLVL